MKRKFLFLFLICGVLSIGSFAQSVVTITPQKKIYTRRGKAVPKERRTFTVVYPAIKSSNPAIKTKLENALNYWKVFDTSLKDNLNDDFWLTDFYYQVNYNKNDILDIALTQEGIGAYPDGQSVNLVIDLKTGERIKFSDAFKADALTALAEMVDKKLSGETAAIIQRINKGEFSDSLQDKEANDSLKEQLNDLQFTADSFDEYSIGDEGVTIIYDAGFPHAVEAAQPEGRYFFTWAELKPYIKSDGLLGKFVR